MSKNKRSVDNSRNKSILALLHAEKERLRMVIQEQRMRSRIVQDLVDREDT